MELVMSALQITYVQRTLLTFFIILLLTIAFKPGANKINDAFERNGLERVKGTWRSWSLVLALCLIPVVRWLAVIFMVVIYFTATTDEAIDKMVERGLENKRKKDAETKRYFDEMSSLSELPEDEERD